VVNFATQLPEDGEISLRVFNLSGQLVREIAASRHSAGDVLETLDVSDLPAGMYVVKMQVGGVESVGKFHKS